MINYLRRKLILQEKTKTPDGRGGYTYEYNDVETIWASIKPISAKEKLRYQQVDTIVSHKVTIRYKAIDKANNRFKYGNRVFDIVELINPDEANERMDIVCVEV